MGAIGLIGLGTGCGGRAAESRSLLVLSTVIPETLDPTRDSRLASLSIAFNVKVLAALAGESVPIVLTPPPQAVLLARRDPRFRVVEQRGGDLVYLAFGLGWPVSGLEGRVNPFRDVRVRRAARLATTVAPSAPPTAAAGRRASP